MNNNEFEAFIKNALHEDIRDGDHTTLSCVPKTAKGKAKLLVKESGILAGIDLAKKIYSLYDSDIKFTQLLKDGDKISIGDIAYTVEGSSQTILTTERLILNIMQRMSGIATQTGIYVDKTKGTNAKLLDTRKTTPGMRLLEKMAVKIGGGENHRIGLYDMIMIKDNHIDFAGGIKQAIEKTQKYLTENKLDLKIEIEARSFDEINEILSLGGVDRIMIDNFTPTNCKKAVEIINNKYETEASGGITLETISDYAKTGVDYISVGALTHQIKSLDLSLKAF